MTAGRIITLLLGTYLIIYIIIQILNFYGIGKDVYGIYLAFFIFLLVTSFVLPRKYAVITR